MAGVAGLSRSCALQAFMEGCRVAAMDAVAGVVDISVSATGNDGAITLAQ